MLATSTVDATAAAADRLMTPTARDAERMRLRFLRARKGEALWALRVAQHEPDEAGTDPADRMYQARLLDAMHRYLAASMLHRAAREEFHATQEATRRRGAGRPEDRGQPHPDGRGRGGADVRDDRWPDPDQVPPGQARPGNAPDRGAAERADPARGEVAA